MLHSVKMSVNDLLKRIYDALVWTLKHSAMNQLNETERTLKEVFIKNFV